MIAGSIEIQLMANISRIQRDMADARRIVGNATDGMARAADAAKAALASIGAGIGLQQLAALSDQYSKFTAQLKLATQSQREYAQAYADVKRISTEAQADLGATGVLYARIANGTRELGVSQQKVAAITETVNLALKVSGATSEEANSAMLQLSQAFAAGALRGEEFNAVNEAAPGLMKILADGMGVQVGALKQMASNGKITSQVMSEVFSKPSDNLKAQAKEVQTIAGAFAVLKGNVMEFVGMNASASGAVSVLTSGIKLLADNLGLLGGVMLTIGAAKFASAIDTRVTKIAGEVAANRALVASNLATAEANATSTASASLLASARVAELRSAVLAVEGEVQLALATNGLIPAQARATAAVEAHALAMGQLTIAQRAASLSTTAASAVIGALGGPIGAVIAVLGIAATAWSWYQSKQEEANRKASDNTEQSTNEIIENIEKQNAKLRERIELAKQAGMGSTAKDGGPEVERMASILTKINELKAKGASLDAASQIQLIDLEHIYGDLKKAKGDNNGLKAELDATGSAASDLIAVRQRLAGVNQQYLDDLTKLQTAREKGAIGEREYVALVSQLATEEYKKSDAAKAAASSATKQEGAYESLIKATREKIATTATEMNGFDKLSESQKLTIKLNDDIAAGLIKRNGKEAATAVAMIAQVAANERVIETQKSAADGAEAMAKIAKDYQDATAKSIDNAEQEADRNEELARTYGMTKAAIEAEEVARLENQLAHRSDLALTADEIDALEKLIAAKKRSAVALGQIGDMEAGKKAAQDLESFLDPAKAQTFGDALRQSFGAAGDSLTKLTATLQDYGIKQAEIEKQRGNAAFAYLTGQKTEKEYLADLDQLNRRNTKNQLSAYGDMAGAAAGFFDEHSKGYKTLMTVSQVFHAAELAMTMAELVPKAISAVLTQGSGDPYTAFGRMAAMAAIVAGLGVAVGGGGGGMSAADRQKAQGTGSVLGDSSAKSDSIAHSVALAAANSSTQIDYLSGMLASLRAIQSNIGSFASTLVRTTGITGDTGIGDGMTGFGASTAGKVITGALIGGAPGALVGALVGGWVGKTLGKIGNAIFGGDESLQDSGFTMQRSSLGGILANGAHASGYADIKTDGGWLHKDHYRTDPTPLATGANGQVTAVLKAISSSIAEAGKLLGVSGDAFNQHLQSFVVDIGKVSLKGLSGDEIQKQLEAVFSKLGDDMAKFAIGGLDQFQKVGEGYLETLTRVATDYAKLDASLTSIGMIFGATGVASIKARENLIDLAGGIDTLAQQANGFAQNFLSKAEQMAPVAKYVNDQLSALGATGIKTRDDFKHLVQGLDLTVPAQQQEYVALMALQDAFAKTHAATVDLTKTEQEVADERKGLQDQLDSLTMTQAQLLDKQRSAIEASNRALFDQVQAAQKAKDAQDAAKSSLSDVISKMGSFRDSTKSLHDSLLTGSLSPLAPEQQYAELRRQYEQTKSAALGGDTTAQNGYASALNAFLTFSQKINGGDSQYASDFAMGQQDSAAMSTWAAHQVDVSQAQLDAMNSQATALDTANVTLLSIAQGITQLPAALSSPINPANYSASDNLSVLVAEVKALRSSNEGLKAELQGLRADQQKQTGGIISGNAQSQEGAAKTIVDGVGGAVARAVVMNRKVELE